MGNYRNLRKCGTAVPRVPQDGSAARGTLRHAWHEYDSICAQGWRLEKVRPRLGRPVYWGGYPCALPHPTGKRHLWRVISLLSYMSLLFSSDTNGHETAVR